jgi:ABC-type glycerol-3-phosphate transport system substrate-binding protein
MYWLGPRIRRSSACRHLRPWPSGSDSQKSAPASSTSPGWTRIALEYVKKLMAVSPPDVYAWDDAGNNRWLISGKGSGIMSPPSAWAVAKRDNFKVAENCWTHPVPRGPKGRFVAERPQFYGIWKFSKNKQAAKDLLLFLSQKESARQLVAASIGYDLPSFKSFYDFETWKTVEPPLGTLYNYPPRGDEVTSVAGHPARPDVAAQIYNQALHTVMVSRFTQGGEKLDDVIKWASNELEGYLRL